MFGLAFFLDRTAIYKIDKRHNTSDKNTVHVTASQGLSRDAKPWQFGSAISVCEWSLPQFRRPALCGEVLHVSRVRNNFCFFKPDVLS